MTKAIEVYDNYFGNIVSGIFKFQLGHSEELDRLIRRAGVPIEAGSRALDYGCGDGRNAEYLCALGYEVDAIDVAANAVEAALERLKGLSCHVQLLAAGAPVEFDDNTFSLIVAWDALHWLGTRDVFLDYLNQFARLLRPGGHLLISMPTPRSYLVTEAHNVGDDSWMCDLDRRKGMRLYAPPLETLKSLAVDHGFEVTRVMSFDYADEAQDGGLDHPFSMYTLCLRKTA